MLVLLLMVLVVPLRGISQTCLPPTLAVGECPLNAHCLSNNYCACDSGFIGGCTQPAVEMQDGSRVAVNASHEQYTFFAISQPVDSYAILIFELCHEAASSNLERIDVWEDKGTVEVLDSSNALAGGRDWEVHQGCLKLTTPLLLFEKQVNGLPEAFVIGIRLTQPGQMALTLALEIDTIDFWDLFIKFLFIIGGIFLLIFLIALGVFVFKWRRRGRRTRQSRENDISHFSNFMPRFKGKDRAGKEKEEGSLNEDSCAVCLLQLGDDEWLRQTLCGHIFHQDCLDEWCKTNLNCPICRHSFELRHCADQESLRSNLRVPLMDQS